MNKISITEVYKRFYKRSLRNLFVLNFLIIATFTTFLAYSSYDKSLNDAKSILEVNKNYIVGLVLAGGDETIREFLENENKKSDIHYFKFISNNKNETITGMKSISLNLANENLGQLYYGVYLSKAIPWMTIMMLLLISLVFTFFFKLAFDRAGNFLESSVLNPLKNLSQSLQGSSSVLDLSQTNSHAHKVLEISLIQDAFVEFTEKLVDSEVAIAKTKVAQQVAHDIRSPLSALEMISSGLTALEEDKRLIIRNSINRIRDIANTLSRDNKPKNLEAPNKQKEIALLSSAIEMIITEKRYEISKKQNIQITFDQTGNSYGLFAVTVLSDFKRALSNLLNNSIEAIGDKDGKIEIVLSAIDQKITLTISDNGCGISTENLDKILKNGVSLKRNKGTGLGLTHAIESVSSWGGKLEIKSLPNQGTTVKIILNQELPPKWFVASLNLTQIEHVIILDDDDTIHQMWKSRLDSIKNNNSNWQIHHFKDSESLERFYGKNFGNLDHAIFMIDYEIHNSDRNGLDVIEFLGIQKQAILVTSHFENESIKNKCQSIGLGMIPKTMAGFVTIEV